MFSMSSSQSTGDRALRGEKNIRALTTKSVHCLSVFSGDLGTPCLLRRTKNLSLQRETDTQTQRQTRTETESEFQKIHLEMQLSSV